MSWRANAYVKDLQVCPNGERLSRTEKFVAVMLSEYHQDKVGGFTFPSVGSIAEDALVDVRTCQRALKSLERKGVIVREFGERQGRGQMTFYRFPELEKKGGHSVPLLAPKLHEKGRQNVTLPAPELEKKGGPDVPLPGASFLGERVTEGWQKGDKSCTPHKEELGTGIETQSPLPPLHAKGASEPSEPSAVSHPDAGAQAQLDDAVDQVCVARGISNRRKRRLVREALELAGARGESPPDAARAMIAALNRQDDVGHLLRRKYGLEKFIGTGIWRDENRWLWDEELLRDRAAASVGTSRGW